MKNSLIKILFLMLFSNIVFAGQTLDQIIAKVNDDVITSSELNKATRIYTIQLKQQNITLPPPATIKHAVLDQLINKKLQLQFAKLAGVSVTDQDVDKALAH